MGEPSGPEVLDPAQQDVLDLCLAGRNVFFSGMGGTGKSFLLRRIVAELRRRGVNVAVTAPTGVAALICGGQTLHSFAGCGVPSTLTDFDKCWSGERAEAWRGLGTLIIDEVSMVQAPFLDWLDCTVRSIRDNDRQPFGGVQLIFCGDFHQLHGFTKQGCASVLQEPPGTPPCRPSCRSAPGGCAAKCEEYKAACRIPIAIKELHGLAFQTACWREARFVTRELTTCFRQADVRMVRALSRIRRGELDSETLSFIRGCERELSAEDGIEATTLYACNRDVDQENAANLAALPPPVHYYRALDAVFVDGQVPERKQAQARAALERDAFFGAQALVPATLAVKKHAQVASRVVAVVLY